MEELSDFCSVVCHHSFGLAPFRIAAVAGEKPRMALILCCIGEKRGSRLISNHPDTSYLSKPNQPVHRHMIMHIGIVAHSDKQVLNVICNAGLH